MTSWPVRGRSRIVKDDLSKEMRESAVGGLDHLLPFLYLHYPVLSLHTLQTRALR